jgi:predicted peroxiredoxin
MHGSAQKLAILLWSVSVERPDLAAAPFVYAAVAGAMDCQVEIHFAGPSVRLLVPGVAAGLRTGAASEKTVYAFMQEAAGFGARFLGCSMALAEHLTARAERIPEFSAPAGAGAFVSRVLDPEWKTLVF